LPSGQGFTVQEIAKKAETRLATQIGEPMHYANPELRDAPLRLVGTHGSVNTCRLGQGLLSKEGRIVGEYRSPPAVE
jgi:hypothetical protein